jgi:ribosomal protein S18 acetylase RimI-like enzyme
MDDAELAAREHDNMIVADMLAAAQVPGALVERSDGLTIFVTGLPMRLFNQALIDGDGATSAAIGGAVTIMRERAAGPFSVTLRRGIDDGWIPVVEALRLVRAADRVWMPGMALHPIGAGDSPHTPPELEIRQTTDAEGVADHIQAAATGFDMPAYWLRQLVTDDLARHADVRLYAGYLDGDPVVAGLGIRSGTTIGVYSIATAPAARRRGFGAAMTQRIVDDGVRDGCEVAVLQASEAGKPIYERMGFRTVIEYDAWSDPLEPG